MKQILGIRLLSIMCFSCKAQDYNKLKPDDYEIINIFLNNMKSYSYLDEKIISEKGLLKKFEGRFNYQLQFFTNADSICSHSKDTIKVKFYCPLAKTFEKYNNVLSDEDFEFLKKTYNNKEEIKIIKIKEIENTTIQEHSMRYYNNVNYKKFKVIPNFNEFPSIRIREIYYTKNKQVAIIAYGIKESYSSGYLNYFILKKQKNIWWEPIGSIKL